MVLPADLDRLEQSIGVRVRKPLFGQFPPEALLSDGEGVPGVSAGAGHGLKRGVRKQLDKLVVVPPNKSRPVATGTSQAAFLGQQADASLSDECGDRP